MFFLDLLLVYFKQELLLETKIETHVNLSSGLSYRQRGFLPLLGKKIGKNKKKMFHLIMSGHLSERCLPLDANIR